MTAIVLESAIDSPAFRVIGGDPNDEELAALAVVLAVLRRDRGNPHAPLDRQLVGGWKSYWHTMRVPMVPGRESWRSTLRR